MKKRGSRTGRLLKFLLLAAGVIAAGPVQAFRCGNEIVSEGARKYEVLDKCGAPDFEDSHAGAYLEGIGPVNVIERWYYNPGPTRFIHILTFFHGRLRSIETGGRGFNPNRRGGACQPNELDVGMSKYELLSRCGKPVARDSWYENAGPRFHGRHHPAGTVLVEEWTYVFGANRFRRFVRIMNGRVVRIELGAKGG